jgi:hypothetical protein
MGAATRIRVSCDGHTEYHGQSNINVDLMSFSYFEAERATLQRDQESVDEWHGYDAGGLATYSFVTLALVGILQGVGAIPRSKDPFLEKCVLIPKRRRRMSGASETKRLSPLTVVESKCAAPAPHCGLARFASFPALEMGADHWLGSMGADHIRAPQLTLKKSKYYPENQIKAALKCCIRPLSLSQDRFRNDSMNNLTPCIS